MISSSSPVKPDIALFLPSLAAGGAERVFVRLAHLFQQRGLHVDLLVARHDGPLRAEVPNTVRLVDLEASRPSRAIPALVRYLRRNRPKAVMSALTHTNIALAIAHRLAKVSSRCVLSEHSDLRVCLPEAKTYFDLIITRLLGRLVYPWADAIVAVSQGVAESVVETFGLRSDLVHVIYNPIDVDDIRRLSQQDEGKFPWPEGLPVVVSVGRLVPAKDHSCLINAFARLNENFPCYLAILGEGEERERLTRLIEKLGLASRVWMPGFVPNPFPWMAKASLLVFSSRWEGLGVVLLEGLALGIPIVSTDCPSGPAEVLEHGRFGTLVPPGDPEKLALAMAKVLASEAPGPPREDALARFDPNRVVEQYCKVFGI